MTNSNLDISPAISWVMPAYNAATYIRQAIESIRSQSFTDWELIIVNDGSTDNTGKIADSYSILDSRIRVIHNREGSGSAFQPRKRAIMEARAQWIAPLDADDFLDKSYLANLMATRSNLNADIVYPLMMNGSDPLADYSLLTNRSFKGADCVKYTLDGWKINCNGGLISRKLLMDVFEKYPSNGKAIYEDEYLTRLLLYHASRVGFSYERYHYRMNPESVTHISSARQLENLLNNPRLIQFTLQHYGEKSEEYKLANRQAFHNYFDALRKLRSPSFPKSDFEYALKMINFNKKSVDTKILHRSVSLKYMGLFLFHLSIGRRLLNLIDKFLNTGINS